jgi:hypothetical protein
MLVRPPAYCSTRRHHDWAPRGWGLHLPAPVASCLSPMSSNNCPALVCKPFSTCHRHGPCMAKSIKAAVMKSRLRSGALTRSASRAEYLQMFGSYTVAQVQRRSHLDSTLESVNFKDNSTMPIKTFWTCQTGVCNESGTQQVRLHDICMHPAESAGPDNVHTR